MNLLRALLVLGGLAIVSEAQRPLNTTTNGTAVLTEPFFVKPTSYSSSKQQYPEQRGGGGSYYSSVHDSPGIRNKEQRLPPPHPNSHLDILMPPLNSVGGQQTVQAAPAPNNRLHKVSKPRNKFNQLRDMMNNATRNSDHSIGRKVSNPERFEAGPHEGGDLDENRPSSRGDSLMKIKELKKSQENQHTPSPPPNDDIDSDEKLGVKCSFEKPCAWTYNSSVTGMNFEVTTGSALKELNLTGALRLEKNGRESWKLVISKLL